MQTKIEARFRSLPVQQSTRRVDRELGVIYGCSAMQAGPALGHGVSCDDKTIQQVADFGNRPTKGIKVRFTHPGMCSDGLGKLVGRARNFRVENDKSVCDIYLHESASRTPDGDLRTYLLDLAEEDPEGFGLSVVINLSAVWIMEDGTEIEDDEELSPRPPLGHVNEEPMVRVKELRAVDFVDEPAANRDGLFSSTSNLDADEMFEYLDAMREKYNLSLEQCEQFASRYLSARQNKEPLAPANNQKEDVMNISADQLAALCEANPAHITLIVAEFKAGKSHDAILASLAQAKDEANAAALAGAIEARKAAEDKAAELAAKVAELEVQLSKARDLGGVQDPGPAQVDSKPQLSFSDALRLQGKELAAALASGAVVVPE